MGRRLVAVNPAAAMRVHQVNSDGEYLPKQSCRVEWREQVPWGRLGFDRMIGSVWSRVVVDQLAT